MAVKLTSPPGIPVFAPGYPYLPTDMTNLISAPFSFQATGVVFRAEQHTQQDFFTLNTQYVIKYGTVLEDPYSQWDATNFRWLAPFTGIYEVAVFCSVATTSCSLETSVAINGSIDGNYAITGATFYTTSSAQLSSLTLGGGTGFARVPLVGGVDYIQGAAQSNVSATVTDVSSAGRYPTMEIAFISQ